MYDASKVYFTTQDTVDKILYESPITSNTYSGSGPITPPDQHNFSIPHTIGSSVIVNGMFSIDAINYYPCGLRIQGGSSGVIVGDQYLICDMYADAKNVYVYIDNGYDTAKTVSIYYTLEALS